MAKDAKKKEDEAAEAEDKDKKEGEGVEGGEGAEGGEGEEGAEGAPKKSKKKLIIIAAVALVVLLGGGVGAYFAFMGGHKEGEEAEKAGEEAAKAAVYYTLPQFLVNLNSGNKQTSFLKATIVLELDSQLSVMSLEGSMPKLMDSFNTYLRELRASDLAGSAGIQRLREELMLRANKASGVKVNDVLFKEIIVQ